MHVGIDACCWSNRRGFGRFTRELLSALAAQQTAHRFTFVVDAETAAASTFPDRVDVVTAETDVAPTEAASGTGRRSLADLWALSRAVRRLDLDAFFFPAVYSYYPVLTRMPVVVTLHDVIADHFPEATFPNRKLMYFWKAKQRLALWQADHLLTVSEASRSAIADYFGWPADRIAVTTEGASDTFAPRPLDGAAREVLARYGLAPDERFVVYVGGISPHKNLGALVDALRLLHADEATTDVRLVLVGDYEHDAFHSDYPRLRRQIDDAALVDVVHFAGYVPDDDLAYLYAAARALAFPSLEEGFGLPALEAMQCGTPVAASRRGSLPEIVGDAGLLFDPLDPSDMARALQTLVTDDALRADLAARSLARAERFSWDAAARMTLALFDEIAAAR